ncbi:nucleoid-associated protein [Weeksellaceae bacterium TAE3-ERU29]|nr:nucleoid-associated protein [Weeksellaceae bacterium TAE3-ERU29]
MEIDNIDKLIIHFIGNKNREEGVSFSESLANSKEIEESIKYLILNSFKSEEKYHFYFQTDLELNPMYSFVKSIFKENKTFIENSKNIGRLLYDKSTHPQIKQGELCIIHFNNCSINGKLTDCLCLFKSESKDTILKVDTTEEGYDLKDEKGISINKLDRGCLIFNTEEENGYLVMVVDNTNKNAKIQYWKDEFLGVRPINDEYQQTKQFLGIAKQFVTKQLGNEFEVNKTDQIDFLNRSVDYFKNNEKFNKDDFETKVFIDDDIIDSFKNFDENYQQNNELCISDSFEISKQAVKKQARSFKSVLKLDKNFHIYIHGNRNLIEQGVDENGKKFYKIYYEQEE